MEQHEKIFKINLKADYRLTNLAVPYLIEITHNIVNISSTAGVHPFPKALCEAIEGKRLMIFRPARALQKLTP